MATSNAHIAGVGISRGSGATLDKCAVAAATKALLDSGVTYGDVDHSIACFLDARQEMRRVSPACLNTFGMKGAPVTQADNQAGILCAVQFITSGYANCVLVVGLDEEHSSEKELQLAVVAFVLVSHLFLTSHAYLKDSAISISAYALVSKFHSATSNERNISRTIKTAVQKALRQARLSIKDIGLLEAQHQSNPDVRRALGSLNFSSETHEPSETVIGLAGTTGCLGLCRLVWQLRGWIPEQEITGTLNCLQIIVLANTNVSVTVLRRSDGRRGLAWDDVKNIRDGRERLGYNPAVEARDIYIEDLEAVRTRKEFRSDEGLKRLEWRRKGGDRAALARL